MSHDTANGLHFKNVASVYDSVRNTDPAVVRAIIERLPNGRAHNDIADVGCGTGRYSKVILTHLPTAGRFYCCDYSPAMLAECRRRMVKTAEGRRIYFSCTSAASLPLATRSLDGLVTFNAVHHFNLGRFLAEAARVLRPDGILAIYTRTPEQNARTIWGELFPQFTHYETRLFTREYLSDAIRHEGALTLEDVREFSFTREETPDELVAKARSHHYSTFALYPPEEFEAAVTIFERELRKRVNGNPRVAHQGHNTLLLARRLTNGHITCDVAP
ncbi:MAG TPA: class I SAM-dependent methyltransferase [candidate division Zixibacteria bacterium]|nr:class I SAM-dependent methyltransferase [candidate division Zixibacteria bacterium]